MRRHRLMGIAPEALEGAMQERRLQHRTALDLLRARLSAAQERLAGLREQKEALSAQLHRLDEEEQRLLQELDQLGEEADRPRQALLERHRRAEAELQEAVSLLRGENELWAGLERQIAEGLMQAVQPYLDLHALQSYPARQAISQAAPGWQPWPGPPEKGGKPHG